VLERRDGAAHEHEVDEEHDRDPLRGDPVGLPSSRRSWRGTPRRMTTQPNAPTLTVTTAAPMTNGTGSPRARSTPPAPSAVTVAMPRAIAWVLWARPATSSSTRSG
jgi:hypothetical protein